MSDIKQSIDYVMSNEVNSKESFVIDNGGPTNWGVTAKYLMDAEMWQYDLNGDRIIDASEMRLFTREDAEKIFENICKKYNIDKIDSQLLSERILDVAINSNPIRAVKFLQSAYNGCVHRGKSLVVDGIIGEQTLSAINSVTTQKAYENCLLNVYRQKRRDFYLDLIAKNPSEYMKYKNGWLVRAAK